MLLQTINYNTKSDYQRDCKPTRIDVNKSDLDNYFKLKRDYFNFLNKQEGCGPTGKTMTFSITNSVDNGGAFKTNLPLEFSEKEGTFIIHVIDDVTYEPQYTKYIYIPQEINILAKITTNINRLSELNYNIEQIILYNQLENIRRQQVQNTVLLENKMITQGTYDMREVKIVSEIQDIKQKYNTLKSLVSNISLELTFLQKFMNQNIDTNNRVINKYILDSIIVAIDLNNIFDELLSSIANPSSTKFRNALDNYQKMDRILNQTDKLYIGDIVLLVSPGSADKVATITNINSTDKTAIQYSIKTGDGETLTPSKDGIKPIKGIYNLLKLCALNKDLFTLSLEEYKKMLQKIGIQNEQEDYSIKIDNKIGKNVLTKKQVEYCTSTRKSSKKVVSKSKSKKVLSFTTEPLHINIVEDNLLYNKDGSTFMFYSLSKDAGPGVGAREILKEGEVYAELYNIQYWRRKLSNFWIQRDVHDNIIPIVIDSVKFASVEHYFHYSKYWNIPNVSKVIQKQFNSYAMKFTYDYKGTDGWGRQNGEKAKLMGSKSSGYEHRKDWFDRVEGIHKDILISGQLGGGDFITLRDYVLLVGIYAKFTQISELKDLLTFTKNALLIHPKGGSPRNRVNEICFQHMYVRYLIKEQKPLIMYDNGTSDLQLFKQSLSEIEKLSKKDEDGSDDEEGHSGDEEGQSGDKEGQSGDKEGQSGDGDAEDEHKSGTGSSGQEPPDLGLEGSHKSPTELRRDKLEKLLISKGHDIGGMSIHQLNELSAKIIKQESLEQSLILSREIETLNNLLLETYQKSIYQVPANGDCGYYAVVEMMVKEDIYPLNFKDNNVEEGQYSSNTEHMEVSLPTQERQYQSIYHDAMLELKNDVANKLNDNLIVGKEQSETIEVIKQSIIVDLNKEGEFTEEIKQLKYNKIKNTHANGGDWISDLELRVISALYNINIISYYSDGRKGDILASESKEIFNTDSIGYNPGRNDDIPTIELGYYANYHYVGVNSRASPLKGAHFEEPIEYYIIDVTLGQEIFTVAFDYTIESDDLRLIGLYNKDTRIITYFKYNEGSRDSEIADQFDEVTEDIEGNPKDSKKCKTIQYYSEITTGLVYNEPDINSPSIGSITLKTTASGPIKKIVFNNS